MSTLLTHRILDRLRTIGDPVADVALQSADRDPARRTVVRQARDRLRPPDGSVQALLEDRWLEANAAAFGLGGLIGGDLGLPDPPRVELACRLFARYGTEIAAALLLAALPEAYAAGRGAKTLLHRSALGAGGAVSTRRIAATGQFVISVMTPPRPPAPVSRSALTYTPAALDVTRQLWRSAKGTDPLAGQALRNAVALRIMHGIIRASAPARAWDDALDPGPPEVALNQEDLLATLLSFSVTVFEALEKLGVCWSADEEDAYFYVWDCVGATLGIGDVGVIERLSSLSLPTLLGRLRQLEETGEKPGGELAGLAVTTQDRAALRQAVERQTLRPRNVAEARALLARLRARMWRLENDWGPPENSYDYENFDAVLDDVRPGRVLMRALLDEVTARLPARQKTWPLAVVRQLVPAPVQNRLALGATTVPGFTSVILAARRGGPEGANWVPATALRQRATQVTASVFLSYLSEGRLEIPGVPAARLGVNRRPDSKDTEPWVLPEEPVRVGSAPGTAAGPAPD